MPGYGIKVGIVSSSSPVS